MSALANIAEGHAGWAGRRVVLTGATGFLGHHLALHLCRLGARVTALVRAGSDRRRLEAAGVSCVLAPLSERAVLERALVESRAETLFHLAAAVDFEEDWDRFYDVNVRGTVNLLAAARTTGVRRVVHTSSIVAVGASREPRALDEAARWDLDRLRVPYITTKRQAEDLALAAAGDNLEVVVVNPGSIVGPDDFAGSEFGTLCRRFWRRRIPFHFGGGNNFVDVRDVAEGMLRAAERGRSGHRYLLTGHNLPYRVFFTELARLSPRPIFRLEVPAALGTLTALVNQRLRRRRRSRSYLTPGQARLLSLFFYFDHARARRDLGYEPRPLRQSLTDTYRFWMGKRCA